MYNYKKRIHPRRFIKEMAKNSLSNIELALAKVRMHLATNVIFCNALGGGICNRIKTIVSCMRMAKHFNKELILYWPPDKKMINCRFSDLFENDFKQTKRMLGLCEASVSRLWILPNEVPEGFAQEAPNYNDLLTKGYCTPRPSDPHQVIDYEFERIPAPLREEYITYFNQLKPIEEIRERVKENAKRLTPEVIGVHARRTDHMKKRGHHEDTDERLIEAMDQRIYEKPDIAFFLATDCPNTEGMLKKRYGKRITTYPKQSYDRKEVRGVQDALVDLLLLSKTSYILGSYWSTFTEVAWWFGQCRPKVEMVIAKRTDFMKSKEGYYKRIGVLKNVNR